jgi:hypothetical protein
MSRRQVCAIFTAGMKAPCYNCNDNCRAIYKKKEGTRVVWIISQMYIFPVYGNLLLSSIALELLNL